LVSERSFFLAVVAAVAILSLALLLSPAGGPSGVVTADFKSVTIGGRTFGVTYLATNQTEWTRGLMDRRILPNTIELFVFPRPGDYSFWMYGVNSSLDIIWISSSGDSGSVVYVVHDAQPCGFELFCTNYDPGTSANMVLEAQGGFASSNDIVAGTMVSLS